MYRLKRFAESIIHFVSVCVCVYVLTLNKAYDAGLKQVHFILIFLKSKIIANRHLKQD